MRRSILLITHFYPPSEMVAARRPAGLVRYLERMGHSVTVVTSVAASSTETLDPATRVIRTGDLMRSRLNWRRRQFEAWTGGGGGTDYEPGVSRLARVLVPDVALVTWAPYAARAALAESRRRRFDCVLTTSGPESIHLVGAMLQRLGMAWVADLRDGWGFESLRDWPLGPQWSADRALERWLLRRADAVSTVTEPISADLRERLGVAAETITNGYDPEDPALADAPMIERELGVHRVFHSGRMGSSEHDPAPVVEALRLLDHEDPELARTVRLSFAGPLTPGERDLLSAPDVVDRVELLGSLARSEVLGRQRAADSLLLLTSGKRRSVATGKLYEYLQARRPILVLGENTEAARIVEQAGAGLVTPVDDAGAIATALRELASGGFRVGAAPEHYGYPAIAGQMAELVERAIERASQRRSRR